MKDPELLEKARDRMIESIAKNMDLYGVTHSIGRLYGAIYFSDAPMTLDQMGQSLGMSKTSMSAGVRVLSDLKMVEKVWVKGDRKDRYQTVEDWYQNFCDYFSIKWRKAVQMNMEAIHRSLAELKQLADNETVSEGVRNKASKDMDKLNNALGYYQWLSQLIESFESHRIFDFIPKISKS